MGHCVNDSDRPAPGAPLRPLHPFMLVSPSPRGGWRLRERVGMGWDGNRFTVRTGMTSRGREAMQHDAPHLLTAPARLSSTTFNPPRTVVFSSRCARHRGEMQLHFDFKWIRLMQLCHRKSSMSKNRSLRDSSIYR